MITNDVKAMARREHLRVGAQTALTTLGQGFLSHPDNTTLRQALAHGSLSASAYSHELIRLVFRFIFLHAFEESGLLGQADSVTGELYKRLSERLMGGACGRDSRHWEAMKIVFRGLAKGDARLDLPALGGISIDEHCCSIEAAQLKNEVLLAGQCQLASLKVAAAPSGVMSGQMRTEELGIVYEGLLEVVPQITHDGGQSTFVAAAGKHNARRTGGSFYTPPERVEPLLDGALEPVVQAAIAAHVDRRDDALLELSVVDPACGSGNVLLAAARRLAAHVGRVRANGTSREADHTASLRDVVTRCLYGVDLDPLAVELCRVALWLEVGDPGLPLSFLDSQVRHGNALIGAAFSPTEPKLAASHNDFGHNLADGVLAGADAAVHDGLAARFFDWAIEYPQVFARAGFDVVLGNPPWIAHGGRAAQPLEPEVKRYYQRTYAAFAGYPTTHGVFITRAARLLRPGGMLGLLIPSSVSELDGYHATRAAHDEICSFPAELIDFGEGAIEGVTQPCMGLVSRRTEGGRSDAAAGAPWPMRRPDLDATARGLLAKLEKLPPLPPALFGERGVQSDRLLAEHFLVTPKPVARFTTPIREGKDVREFQLLPPQNHVDRSALGSRMRGAEEYAAVRVVVRQTARYPIAALSDGCAFRNSLLAVFETPLWPAHALVALLNSATIRWLHHMRFRDARQPVMPQVKVGHLRSIPDPSQLLPDQRRHLALLGERLSQSKGGTVTEREELDLLIANIYGLDAVERAVVDTWHAAVAMPDAERLLRTRATGAARAAAIVT
jgi:SAM-dependent methyltransferase